MLNKDMTLIFVLVWSLFLSNGLTSLLGLTLVNPLSRLTTLRVHLLIPAILAAATVACSSTRGKSPISALRTVSLGIGFVLGTLFESNLQLTRRLQEIDRINIWTRPIALTLMGLAVLSMLMPHLAHRRATRRASSPLPGGPTPDLCARGPRCSGHVRGLDDASSARLVPTFVLVPTAALFL